MNAWDKNKPAINPLSWNCIITYLDSNIANILDNKKEIKIGLVFSIVLSP